MRERATRYLEIRVTDGTSAAYDYLACEFFLDTGKMAPGKGVSAAMGGGYHSLCAMHFPKHQNFCVTLDEARRGKVPKVMRPTPLAAVLSALDASREAR